MNRHTNPEPPASPSSPTTDTPTTETAKPTESEGNDNPTTDGPKPKMVKPRENQLGTVNVIGRREVPGKVIELNDAGPVVQFTQSDGSTFNVFLSGANSSEPLEVGDTVTVELSELSIVSSEPHAIVVGGEGFSFPVTEASTAVLPIRFA